jgi:hypothetical protein
MKKGYLAVNQQQQQQEMIIVINFELNLFYYITINHIAICQYLARAVEFRFELCSEYGVISKTV